jgi:hypothetical protein
VAAALDAYSDEGTSGWVVQGRLDGRSGSTILAVGPDPSGGALLKVSDRPWGRSELEHQVAVLTRLHADARLGPWRDLLPRVLARGEVSDVYWALETRLAGGDGRRQMTDPERATRLASGALAAITELHTRTAALTRVGDHELERWVRLRVARVRTALHGRDRLALDRMEQALSVRLCGLRLATGWTHGDYHPGNVLSSPDGHTTGIVDWCAAEADGMVLLDVVGFMLSVEMSVRGLNLGAVVARHLRAGQWPVLTPPVRQAQLASRSDEVDCPTLVLLAWLRHAAHFVATEPPGVLNPVWVARNLRPVVRAWARSREGGTPR